MQKFYRCTFYTIIALLSACIDPFSLDTERNEPILTVDGLLSTEPGRHKVRLTRTDRYGSVFDGQISTVNNATVAIRDEDGNTVLLTEFIQDSVKFFNSSDFPYTTPQGRVFPPKTWVTQAVFRRTGIYETPPNYKAEVGKSYTLLIELANGERYSSIPQTVLPVAPITNISYVTYRNPTSNPLLESSGVRIMAHFNDPGDESNFYFWRVSNPVYPYITNPELARGGPKDCCARCFRFDDNDITRTYALSSDESFNGIGTLQPTIAIGDDGWRFKDRLRVDFHQYSASESGFRFLRLVKQQAEIQGSVFDPPPANIRGNMISIDNPSKQVLGYFFASDVSTKRLYIKSTDLTFLRTPGQFPDDCRQTIGFSGPIDVHPPADWVQEQP